MRISWDRYGGDDIEAVVAMLLCREHPDAFRIRPSKGDQGIDIAVPSVDGSLEVYQVKKFHDSLTPKQWGQVKKSYNRLRESPWAADRTVTQWHLVMPLDSTTQDLDKLALITADAPWQVHWKGLAFVEGLVATYPTVVDYYLRDGKDRLDASVQKLTDLLAMQAGIDKGPGALSPAEAIEPLQSLFSVLDEADPFYAYALSVDPTPPDPKSLEVPHMVAAVTRGRPATGFVTIKIIARCAESTRARPVPFKVTFNLNSSSELSQKVKDFDTFGVPITVPAEAVSGSLDLPGGLGGAIDGADVTIRPVDDSGDDPDLRLQVLDSEDVVLAECTVTRTEQSGGVSGHGYRTVHQAPHGALALELRFDLKAGTTALSLSPGDVTGAPPAEVLPAMEVHHAALRPPNRIRVSLPYGPVTAGSTFPAPETTNAERPEPDPLLELARALGDIQAVTTQRIVMPAPHDVTLTQVQTLTKAAALARGETISQPWTQPGTLQFEPGKADMLEPGLFTFSGRAPLEISVGQQKIDMGYQERTFVAVELEADNKRVLDDHVEIDVKPTENSELTLRRVTSPDLPVEPDVSQP